MLFLRGHWERPGERESLPEELGPLPGINNSEREIYRHLGYRRSKKTRGKEYASDKSRNNLSRFGTPSESINARFLIPARQRADERSIYKLPFGDSLNRDTRKLTGKGHLSAEDRLNHKLPAPSGINKKLSSIDLP